MGPSGTARWLLRPLGLDPGRSLANAQPTPAEQHAQRIEMWMHVQRRFPRQGRPIGDAGAGTLRPVLATIQAPRPAAPRRA